MALPGCTISEYPATLSCAACAPMIERGRAEEDQDRLVQVAPHEHPRLPQHPGRGLRLVLSTTATSVSRYTDAGEAVHHVRVLVHVGHRHRVPGGPRRGIHGLILRKPGAEVEHLPDAQAEPPCRRGEDETPAHPGQVPHLRGLRLQLLGELRSGT